MAANCAVGDNPRTVDVDTAAKVAFVITCVAAGTVHVTTATSGIDVPYGYAVCFDGSGTACAMWASVPANSAVTISSVIAGHHTVTLAAAANCTVSGGTTRSATVPQDGTANAAFDVACVEVDRIAFSRNGRIVISRVDTWESRGIAAGFAPAWSPNRR